MINIEISNQSFAVDFDALPPQSKAFIIAYGLKQKLADAGASKKSDEEKLEAASKMLDRLIAGDLSRAAKASVNPVEAAMSRIATRMVKALLKTAKREEVIEDEEAFDKVLSAYMDKNEATLRTMAEAEIEAKRAAKAAAGALSDLGL